MSAFSLPLLAKIEIRHHHHRHRAWNLWFPLFVLWLLCLPIVLVLLPIFFLGCLVTWIDPFRALGIFWEILSALKGMHFEIEHSGNHVRVRLQ